MTDLTMDEVPTAVLRVLVAIHGDETSDGDEADVGGDVLTAGRSDARPTDVGNAHGGVDVDLTSPGDLARGRTLVGSGS